MTVNGWIQIAIYFRILTAFVVPLGRFMARVFEGECTFLTPVLRPVEIALYRVTGVDEKREQHWLPSQEARTSVDWQAAEYFRPSSIGRRILRLAGPPMPRTMGHCSQRERLGHPAR
jgi:hypothetical protein